MAKFHFRYGAMNAGKSTILLQTAYNYEEKGKNIVLLKPSIDTKGDRKIVSRIGLERKVDYLIGLITGQFLKRYKNDPDIILSHLPFKIEINNLF